MIANMVDISDLTLNYENGRKNKMPQITKIAKTLYHIKCPNKIWQFMEVIAYNFLFTHLTAFGTKEMFPNTDLHT